MGVPSWQRRPGAGVVVGAGLVQMMVSSGRDTDVLRGEVAPVVRDQRLD